MIQASRHDVFVTPTYLVNELYARRLGTKRLQVRVESPTFDTTREGQNIPYLDAVVTRSRRGGRIFVKLVNTDSVRDLRTTFEISGAEIGSQATIETIDGKTLDATNSFSNPDAIVLQETRVAAGRKFVVEIPGIRCRSELWMS